MQKPSVALCLALREAWVNKKKVIDLPEELLSELLSLVGFVKFTQDIRAFLATRNVLASNCLFDDAHNTAVKLMLKHGFADMKRPEGPNRQEIKRQLKATDIAISAARDHRALSARRAWNVCK